MRSTIYFDTASLYGISVINKWIQIYLLYTIYFIDIENLLKILIVLDIIVITSNFDFISNL